MSLSYSEAEVLAKAVVGDVVIVFDHSGRREPYHSPITAVTATQVTVDGRRFLRSMGTVLGATQPHRAAYWIRPATDKVRAEIADEAKELAAKRRLNDARTGLRQVVVDRENIDQVEAFLNALDAEGQG